MAKFFGKLHNHPKNSKLNIKFVEKYDNTYFEEGPKNRICEGATNLHDKILWAKLFDQDTACRIPTAK